MELSWEKFLSDYQTNSQEFLFHYLDKDIWLCWSGDEEFRYAVNVLRHDPSLDSFIGFLLHPIRSRNRRSVQYEKYRNQKELLENFRLDGKTLQELWDRLS